MAIYIILNWHIGQFYIGRHRWLMIAWVMLFTGVGLLVFKFKAQVRPITRFLNIIALLLVVTSLLSIAKYSLSSGTMPQENQNPAREKAVEQIPAQSAKDLPDIYYIILDGYARSDVLLDLYEYDNHEFIEYLRKKGFYVASQSCSNYVTTSLSLASSLNMEYINYLSETVGRDSKDQRVVIRKIKNSTVMKFLRSQGYAFINLSSSSSAMERNAYADVDIREMGISEFQMVLIQTTMLSPFHTQFTAKLLRKKILFSFSKLAEIHTISGPKFVFAHIIIPHPPFLFDAHGNPAKVNVLKMGGMVWTEKKKYIDQLMFANKKIQSVIDAILQHSSTAPIIVLQGDHGPSALLSDGVFDGWHNPNNRMLTERMSILNAYYMPGNKDNRLYQSITPVNTFRLIFNEYFNADYKLLEDRSYFSNYDQPYFFIDVTDQITYN